MAKSKNGDTTDNNDSAARLETSAEDKAKAAKWFQRARELGEKRQFDYALEYYINGLEFWPDAVEEACKPLHGCAVARRQTGGKKPGFKDTMKRSVNDKDIKQALLNSLWLFGRDSDNINYIEAIVRNASKLRAEDAALWASGVFQKALETSPKANHKLYPTLAQFLDELGTRATEREEIAFGSAALQRGVEVLNLWRRRVPKDDRTEGAIKNMTTRLTILKGRYQDDESYRESIVDSEEQVDRHDEHRSMQAEERVVALIAKAEREHKADLNDQGALRRLVDMLCRREQTQDETKAIGHLIEAYKRSEEYRWKQSADDIRMKQLERARREVEKSGNPEKLKEHRIAQLRFELAVFKERVSLYPTDNRLKYEYGVRNFQASRFDDAIPLFQVARSDPKNRVRCGLYLGRCFLRKKYYDQAIMALEAALEAHEMSDDDMAKSMLYWLARSQEGGGDREAARKSYGKILQLDYTYGDARARLDALSE